jgi:NADPH:quinone reductase-like Zn-dependent oxidoreductase
MCRFADVGAPDANEVVVALEASPINQYDLLMIGGGYGYRPPLPAIVGTEGVGRVIAVGRGRETSQGRRSNSGAVCTRLGQNA